MLVTNISVTCTLCGDIEAHQGTKFKDASLDVVLLSNVLFQFERRIQHSLRYFEYYEMAVSYSLSTGQILLEDSDHFQLTL